MAVGSIYVFSCNDFKGWDSSVSYDLCHAWRLAGYACYFILWHGIVYACTIGKHKFTQIREFGKKVIYNLLQIV